MRNKRHTLSGLAALTLFDLVAAQAQAQTPVPFNWTGFYVGGHVGQRWGNVTTNFPMGDIPGFTGVRDSFGIGAPPFLNIPTKRHPDSGIIGVHAGYNLHFAPTWLVGLETSWDWGRGIDDFVRNFANNSTDSFGTLQLTTKLTWSGTVRGRFGYVQNDWLFYGTGGVAFQRINVSALGNMTQFFAGDSISVLTNFSAGKTLVGWAAGAGIERHTQNGWTLRVEYLFAEFGTVNLGRATATATAFRFGDLIQTTTSTQNVAVSVYTQTLKVGFSKLFSP